MNALLGFIIFSCISYILLKSIENEEHTIEDEWEEKGQYKNYKV